MTNNKGNNPHFGLIRSISDGIIEVGVEAPIACSSCEVSSSCGLADHAEKIIHVKSDRSSFDVGEKVALTYEETLSSKALLLVYVLPIVVIILAIIVANSFTDNELIIGLSALLSLLPYFLLFKLFSKSINRVFSFSILKMEELSHLKQNA
jgi:sigma-E factor negative regulatory protein RseC